ncbi:hypothetical protein SSX86_023540 [Deinandra increscens subsp. villosa]|uniref:DUF7138 domain-containing protein n=1 Tax=Deinandra increscens subsp. villosa TaxID=3103831 RepID=A0AAP0CQH3_9ASTR
MVEADDDPAATAAFPVVLFDGERETNVGSIEIRPDLVYKEFQTILSRMIGISYNNLTSYLVDSKKSKVSPDRRKILITGKANFAAVVRETNCFFLVVLKRSRRDRRRKPVKQIGFRFDFDFPSPILISPDDLSRISWNHHHHLHNHHDFCFYDDRFHDLLMRRENYNYMNMILNSGYRFDSPSNMNFPRIEDENPRVFQSNLNRSLCEDCTVAQKQGEVAEFHLCVYDEVVVGGFRSPAGPVARPL